MMNVRFCGLTANAKPQASPAATIFQLLISRRSDNEIATTAAHAAALTACPIVACRSEYQSSGEPNHIPIAASVAATRPATGIAACAPSNNTTSPAIALDARMAIAYGSEKPFRGNARSIGSVPRAMSAAPYAGSQTTAGPTVQ